MGLIKASLVINQKNIRVKVSILHLEPTHSEKIYFHQGTINLTFDCITYLHIQSNKDQVVEKQKKRNRHLPEI